jgi:hypothetical protein
MGIELVIDERIATRLEFEIRRRYEGKPVTALLADGAIAGHGGAEIASRRKPNATAMATAGPGLRAIGFRADGFRIGHPILHPPNASTAWRDG